MVSVDTGLINVARPAEPSPAFFGILGEIFS